MRLLVGYLRAHPYEVPHIPPLSRWPNDEALFKESDESESETARGELVPCANIERYQELSPPVVSRETLCTLGSIDLRNGKPGRMTFKYDYYSGGPVNVIWYLFSSQNLIIPTEDAVRLYVNWYI